ncbi:hypothetical protein GCM10023237_41100 [Streptomyces coeruleoprunus]
MGASGGPASLPSQARIRTGSGTPISSSASAASREAASDMVHTSVTVESRNAQHHVNTDGHGMQSRNHASSRAIYASAAHGPPAHALDAHGNAPRGRPHHGWRAAPRGWIGARRQDALAFSGAEEAAAGAGAGLAAS